MTHVDLIAKPLDIVEPKPESLVSPHAGKRSRIGQRVTEAAQLLRRADQCPKLDVAGSSSVCLAASAALRSAWLRSAPATNRARKCFGGRERKRTEPLTI